MCNKTAQASSAVTSAIFPHPCQEQATTELCDIVCESSLCMIRKIQISVSDSSEPPEQPLVSRMINTTQDRQHVISGPY